MSNTLDFIDVSSHQGAINVGAMFDAGHIGAVVSKATEGIGYTNPYCDAVIQAALSRNKPCGIYHFARENDATAEANYFVKETQGYIGKCIPILDWEASALNNGTAWALRWLQAVEAAYGYKPWIYMSASVTNSYDWSAVVAGDYGLWVADYTPPLDAVGYWNTIAAWQYTSTGRVEGYAGNLDKNYFYGTVEQWNKYITPKVQPTPEPAPAPAPEPEGHNRYKITATIDSIDVL